jgi:hypothetical protein
VEGNVVSSAGAKHRSNRMEIIDLIRRADRVPAQWSTTYEHLVVHNDPANDPVGERAPVGLTALLLTVFLVPQSRAPHPRRFGPVGQLLGEAGYLPGHRMVQRGSAGGHERRTAP